MTRVRVRFITLKIINKLSINFISFDLWRYFVHCHICVCDYGISVGERVALTGEISLWILWWP